MQVKGRQQIEAFLARPAEAIEIVLLYGRDPGLVRERSQTLERSILGADPDPFRRVELGERELKAAPSALYEEAASLAMLGGSKFIRVRSGDAVAAGALKSYLSERASGSARPRALIVIEAGDLRAGAALRKDAESSPLVAAIAAYPDDAEALEDLIAREAKAAGVRLAGESAQHLAGRLGADRGISRQEIEKLFLYAGAYSGGEAQPIDEAMIDTVVGDASAAEIDGLTNAVFSGDTAATDRLTARLLADGHHPVRLIRSAAMYLGRVRRVAGGEAEGGFGADRLRRHAHGWSETMILRASSLLIEAELQCKTTGQPGEAIASRAFLSIARAVPRANR